MLFIERIRKVRDILWNSLLFYNKKITKGSNVIIRGKINVYGEGEVVINDNVIINSHIRYNPIGGQSSTSFFVTKGAKITIGRGSGISNSAFCAMNRIELGKDVYIGGDCRIYDTDFHSIKKNERVNSSNCNVKTKPVFIDDGVWLGASCIVLKGVTIGKNSVVGAGSVVTKDIPPNQIWAGNPAHYIKDLK